MAEMAISKFKATCLQVLERVRRTGKSVVVTRHGKPVARVLPPLAREAGQGSRFGCMSGTARERGDVVEPVASDDWEAMR